MTLARTAIARIEYVARAAATGLSFVVFGFVGIIGGLVLFPPLCLSAPDAEVARRRAQGLTHRLFKGFSRFMARVGVLRYEIQGAERLRAPGQMIVANHPSLIDVVLLIGYLPTVDCIVKPQIFANPFMKHAVRWLGYIAQTTPEQLFTDAQESLRHNRSLLIFPEGTRTVPGRPIRLGHGAARMALQVGATVLPVTIRVSPPHLFKHQPWWLPPVTRPHYVIKVGEPYSVRPFLDDAGGVPSVAARRLSRHWEEYFAEHLGDSTNKPLVEQGCTPHYNDNDARQTLPKP